MQRAGRPAGPVAVTISTRPKPKRGGAGAAIARLCLAACLLPALLWLTAAPPAFGGATGVGRSDILLRGDLIVYRLAAPARDFAFALDVDPDVSVPIDKKFFEDRRPSLERYLGDGLRIASDTGPCALVSITPDYRGMPEIMAATIAHRCASPPKRLTVEYDLFFETDPIHRNLGEVSLGDRSIPFVFDPANRLFAFDTAAGPPVPETGGPATAQSWFARFASILMLGVDHTIIGLDHVLFLVALAIARLRAWPIFKAVTAFTIAHTITMALAWYGVADPHFRLAEILIAATIAFIALQNLLNRGMEWRWAVAFAFGIFHGLGFYDVLDALEFEGADAATILLAFNLGIEIGQLAIVGALAAALVRWRDRDWFPSLVRLTSLLILIAAGFWIIERSLPA